MHTVGPRYWNDARRESAHAHRKYRAIPGCAAALAGAYRSCLNEASRHGVNHIAMPAVSCGVFGYPVAEAAQAFTSHPHTHSQQMCVPVV